MAADSLRSNLAKNGLMLLKEIFYVNKTSNIDSKIMFLLITKLYEKSISDKVFLRNEAKEGIIAIETNKTGLN